MSRNPRLVSAKQTRKRKRDQGRRKRERQARQGQPGPKARRRAEAAREAKERRERGVSPYNPQVVWALARERMRMSARRLAAKGGDPWATPETEEEKRLREIGARAAGLPAGRSPPEAEPA